MPSRSDAARWVLTVLVAALAVSTMLDVVSTPVADHDVWWIAAAGRQMMSTGRVPTSNVFSFVEPAHPWIMHEWLLGPLYAAGLFCAGPRFFVVIAAAVFAGGLGLLLAGTVGQTRRAETGLVLTAAAVFFFGWRLMSARPTSLSLLFPLVLAVLVFVPRFTWVHAALVVAVESLWTNVHGSFPLGLALIALSVAEQTTDRRARVLALVGSLAVTLVNPYGIDVHRLALGYLTGGAGIYREINVHIIEFQSVVEAWDRVARRDIVGAVVIVGLSLHSLREPRHRLRAVFCLLLFAAALRQVRHFELAGLLSCVLLAPSVDAGTGIVASKRQRAAAAVTVLFATCAVGACTFLRQLSTRSDADFINGGRVLLPPLRALPDGANLYIPLSEAGLAIWYGFPRGIRVFFDSRNDCYSASTFAAFREMSDPLTPPGRLEQLLRESGTTAAVIGPGHGLERILWNRPGWSKSKTTLLTAFFRDAKSDSIRP